MADDRTLELSRAITNEKEAREALLVFASQIQSTRGNVGDELMELATKAVRAHERVDRVTRLGHEPTEEEKTIHRLESVIDLAERVAQGEPDPFLANDYGGLGYDQHPLVRAVYCLRDHSAQDIRDAGWSVAVHNDYVQDGKKRTFWLFTHPSGRYVKGEAPTDKQALDDVREQIWPQRKTP